MLVTCKKTWPPYITKGMQYHITKSDGGQSMIDYTFIADDGLPCTWFIHLMNEYFDLPISEIKQEVIACECGKEKHGFASHSYWCPKVKIA